VLHALNTAINETMEIEPDYTKTGISVADAFASKRGVRRDFAHLTISAARHLGYPARYVSGYVFQPDAAEQPASHAWAEVLVGGLGWVGFDAMNDICPTDAYVRVAVGLDANDAAPVRGARFGGEGEELTVRVTVEDLSGRR
jgi:transglutaminase-like putative cysteine protease